MACKAIVSLNLMVEFVKLAGKTLVSLNLMVESVQPAGEDLNVIGHCLIKPAVLPNTMHHTKT